MAIRSKKIIELVSEYDKSAINNYQTLTCLWFRYWRLNTVAD